MNSMVMKTTKGLGAAILALGLTAAPTFAAAASTAPERVGSAVTQSVGHWAYKGTYNTYQGCASVRDYYESFDVTAQCRYSLGRYQLFIWVLH